MGVAAIRRYLLRASVVLLCGAALADVRPLAGGEERLPVALVDVSASVGEGPPRLPPGLRAQPHWIVVAEGWQEVVGGAQAPRLGRGATDLGGALRHIAETRPGADVLLVSDGRDTVGDGLAGARQVAARGGRLFTLPPTVPVPDVGLESARLRAAGPRAIVEADVVSSVSGHAELRLVRGETVAARRTLPLIPGLVQRVQLEDPDPPAAGTTYEVLVVAAPETPDDDGADNRLVVGLRPERRVVLLWGLPEARDFRAGDLVVRATRDPDLAALEGADCAVVANTPWRDLGAEGVAALQRFVAAGGRLLLLGGPDAYAGGGWAGTPLERQLSPLRVPREEGVGLGLVLALDRSGSTRGETLGHLREAVRRGLMGVTPGERMAVLPFAGAPDAALLGPGVVGDDDMERRTALLEALDDLEARGDTDLPAAVRAAARHAGAIQARERRVLLLTDGDPGHPPDVEALRRTQALLAGQGVGFGAFVVGDAEAVARLRTYLAAAPEDVQSLEEAASLSAHLLHTLGAIRDRSSRLPRPHRLASSDPETSFFGLEELGPAGLQRLEVDVGSGARIRMLAVYEDLRPRRVPFAAVRPVGAGEVAALAWGPALEPREGRQEALAVLGPWIRVLAARADRGLAADLAGETLSVIWPQAAGRGRIVARSPKGAANLIEVEPGLFRGAEPPGSGGGVRVQVPSGELAARPLRMPSRPPAEHRGAGPDEGALQALAAAGGGRRLAAGEAPPAALEGVRLALAPWLLLLACILLVVDRFWAQPDAAVTDPERVRLVGPTR